MRLKLTVPILFAVSLLALSGCGSSESGGGSSASGSTASDRVGIDGSSTVTPIFAALAEEFTKANPNARVTVSTSGTGGGFKKFLNGETELTMASRPITDEELALAKKNGVEFIEIPIAFDGLSVVVNPENDWVDHLTVAELKRIWEPGSQIKSWKDVRPGFPDVPLKLYGAGTDSGTFDYFTLAINGKERASRTDYTASEDDNILVQGVKGDRGSLGYFGYAYYEENRDSLRLIPIDGGKGPVAASPETIANGTYFPLSRPLFAYVSKKKVAENATLRKFMEFFFDEGSPLVREVGYIPFPDDLQQLVRKHFDEGKTGSAFKGAEVGVGVAEIISRERADY